MIKVFSACLIIAFVIYTGSSFVNSAESIIPISSAKAASTENNWLRIFEFKMDGVAAYYNSNSFSVQKNGQYNRVEIIMVYDNPITVNLDGKDYIISSVVKTLAAECNVGLMAPMYDMYFDVQFPAKETLPLVWREYPKDFSSTVTTMPKKSIFHRILCSESV